MAPVQIRVDQANKTPVTTHIGPELSYRYAFDRSADSIQSNALGQDYLTICSEGERLAFVLCDGVSQSFFGDLAARILGEALVEWLWYQASDFLTNESDFADIMGYLLDQISETARIQVANYTLPEGLAPMLQAVLENKRGLGSESMFSAGYLDLSARMVHLAWMGDTRLRIWGRHTERTADLLGKDNFQTRERWSTHRSRIGTLHTARISTQKIFRLVAYSDGMAKLDRRIGQGSPSNTTLERLIEESKLLPTSDDISLLEVSWGKKPQWDRAQPKPPAHVKANVDIHAEVLTSSWRPVRQASGYDLALISPQYWQIYSVKAAHWSGKLNELPPRIQSLAVRTWREEEAGPWSNPLPAQLPKVTSAVNREPALIISLFKHKTEPIRVEASITTPSLPIVQRRDRLQVTLIVVIFIGLVIIAGSLWALEAQGFIIPSFQLTTAPAVLTQTAGVASAPPGISTDPAERVDTDKPTHNPAMVKEHNLQLPDLDTEELAATGDRDSPLSLVDRLMNVVVEAFRTLGTGER